MAMVLSEKQKELRPNLGLFTASYIALTAICNSILFYSAPTIMDMRIMIPFIGIAVVLLIGHIIAYIIRWKQFISHMNNIIEALPLSKEQKAYLVIELKKRSKGSSQDFISKKIHELTTKIEEDKKLTKREIEAVNKIVFGHQQIRPIIENNLNQ
ncbi:hypothetical protein EV207_11927 [Scopulibacillus darangshiensis]|uniref:Uncharacterized protein n=1 Tax=Scopulibacillus darangshiensis TaxID=442528 RepID=A0A4V2SMA8_9BACL|nr:hypothetical protein [Scopulibacillus darangshiensis]TCP26596.1 hypothetical protein EV207_11927 [Scopulibacillus darangshiensis]